MENAARTQAHLARIRDRDTALRAALAAILPRAGAFTWEVGCGHGHFLAAYAEAHPGRCCIGVDIASDRIGRAERKRARARLGNLHFLQADAVAFLAALPAHARLSEIYVLFPDPWPKRRHHKNRVLQPSFLAEMAKRAGQGARLFFRTDVRTYFAYVEDLIKSMPEWELVDGPWSFEVSTVFQARAPSHRSLVAVRTGISPAARISPLP
jgi:tRNA (guanine-N7-)-methyltransferase